MNEKMISRIEELMLERGHSMKSLSLEAGQGDTFIRDILKRKADPSVSGIRKVASVLGVSVAYLLGETDDKSEPDVISVVMRELESGTSPEALFMAIGNAIPLETLQMIRLLSEESASEATKGIAELRDQLGNQ